MPREKKKTSTVRSVERAIAILKSFSIDCTELTLGEISERVGLPKSTVHRILCSLEQENFIEQDEYSGEYRLGYELIRLGVIASEEINLRKIALPEMRWLSKQTQQTSNLYVIRDFQRLCIEQVSGPQYVRRYSYLGALLPLYCGASGKVLLAYMGEQFLEEFFDNVKIEKLTDNTITDKDKIISELDKIRAQGYSVSLAEREPISASASAPIFDYSGKVVASLTVSGPVQMFTDENMEKYVALLLKASKRISARLGHRP